VGDVLDEGVIPVREVVLCILRLYLSRRVWVELQCTTDGLGGGKAVCHRQTGRSRWEVEEQQDINIARLGVIEGRSSWRATGPGRMAARR